MFDDEKISVSSWRGYFSEICTILQKRDSELFDKISSENLLHKSTSKKSGRNGKDPIITQNKNLLVIPIQIADTKYYCEGCLSSRTARRFAKNLLDLFNMTDKVTLFVTLKSND